MRGRSNSARVRTRVRSEFAVNEKWLYESWRDASVWKKFNTKQHVKYDQLCHEQRDKQHANKKLEQGNEQGSGRGNEKNCSTKCETSARDWARELWPLEMTCTLVCDFPYFHSFRSLDLSSFIIFPSSLSFYRSLLWFIVCHFYFICSFYRFVNFLLLYLIFFLLSISCCCSSFVVWFSFSVLLISHTLDSYSLNGTQFECIINAHTFTPLHHNISVASRDVASAPLVLSLDS